jgi:hypothetical protein
MHDHSKITRRRALQMAGAVAGLAAGASAALPSALKLFAFSINSEH